MNDEYDDEPLWCKNNLAENPKPDEKTWGDWLLKPGKELSFRHRQLCIMLSMGISNKIISEKLSVSSSHISILKGKKEIIQEVDRLQDKMFAEDIEKRLKGCGAYAADVIEKTLTSDDPEIKFDQKASMAKWLAEKLTGKASQEVKVEGNLLGNLMDQLDQMQVKGQALSQEGKIIDVTPKEGAEPQATKTEDRWTDWLETNVLEEKKEA